MLVLALDTSTPAITAGVVELTDRGRNAATIPRSARVTNDPRKHAELLLPSVLAAAADAGVTLRELAAIVVGTGPGPFTGLRVGMVTAAALGDALALPVHGVCSLDAIAADAIAADAVAGDAVAGDAVAGDAVAGDAVAGDAVAGDAVAGDAVRGRPGGRLLVVTDARRREVYWAAYDESGHRVDGPHVSAPAVLLDRLPELAVSVAAGASASVTGLPVVEPASPSPAGLVAVAAPALRAGVAPAPLEPLYLRRPDAVEPGPRKPVSIG